jgi:hypothetical protein
VSTLELVVDARLKDAVTPLGRVDVTARLTFPLKPPASVTEIVAVVLAPCTTFTVPEDEEIQKPGTAGPARSSMSD